MRDAAGNRGNGIALFHEADEDGGGSIDGEELDGVIGERRYGCDTRHD